jgi:hypothetical protein
LCRRPDIDLGLERAMNRTLLAYFHQPRPLMTAGGNLLGEPLYTTTHYDPVRL